MLENADLEAAVVEGIVTPAQATALREMARRRTHNRGALDNDEERFRFMRGFNDFFFAIGVVLLAYGIQYFAGVRTPGMTFAAALMWLLAELLVRRMRLILPGILLACFFVLFVFIAIPAGTWFGTAETSPTGPIGTGILDQVRLMVGDLSLPVVARALVAAAAAAAFFARFRLPFALLLLAMSLVVAVLVAATLAVPANSTELLQSLILLACGIAVFAAAMVFDASDRERVTPRADSAFWLHLLAAPLIVHALIRLVTAKVTTLTPAAALTIFLIVIGLAVVAVAIDRRALLVSALTYLGVVIGYALTHAGASGNPSSIFAGTLVLLGALIVSLGVGWVNLRRLLIALLSPGLANHLPPVAARA